MLPRVEIPCKNNKRINHTTTATEKNVHYVVCNLSIGTSTYYMYIVCTCKVQNTYRTVALDPIIQ